MMSARGGGNGTISGSSGGFGGGGFGGFGGGSVSRHTHGVRPSNPFSNNNIICATEEPLVILSPQRLLPHIAISTDSAVPLVSRRSSFTTLNTTTTSITAGIANITASSSLFRIGNSSARGGAGNSSARGGANDPSPLNRSGRGGHSGTVGGYSLYGQSLYMPSLAPVPPTPFDVTTSDSSLSPTFKKVRTCQLVIS